MGKGFRFLFFLTTILLVAACYSEDNTHGIFDKAFSGASTPTSDDVPNVAEACDIPGDVPINETKKIINAIPARVQWNENNGYCGATSIISAGLYYGQYVSQCNNWNL